MGMFAGIDWGGKSHQLAVVDDDGRTVTNQAFDHDVAGVAGLVDTLDEHRFELEGVAIERAEGLLVDAIQGAGLTVYAVSPRISVRARERYQAAPRTNDRFGACQGCCVNGVARSSVFRRRGVARGSGWRAG
jgi:hypothetical protein